MKKCMKNVVVTLPVLGGLQALALTLVCTAAHANDLQIADVKAKYAALFSLAGNTTKRMMLENE